MKSENGGAGHVIGAMLERFREKEPPVPGENEYIGENGLLFCNRPIIPRLTKRREK